MQDVIGRWSGIVVLLLACWSVNPLKAAEGNPAQWSIASALEQLSINGEWNEDQAQVMIQAVLKGMNRDSEKVIYATSVRQAIYLSRDQLRQQIALRIDALQGDLQEVALLSQSFIKDSRRTMDDLVREAIGKLGENIIVRRIARFEVGESAAAETAAAD